MRTGIRNTVLLTACALFTTTLLAAATIGFDLKDPAIVEAMELLESGRVDDARKKLTEADKSAAGAAARRHSIQIGQAIVDIRDGDYAKARSILAPLTKLDDEVEVAYMAEALQLVVQKAGKKSDNASKHALIAGEAWAEILTESFDAISREAETADTALIDLCKKQQFQRVESQLEKCCDLRERALAISFDEIESKRASFVREHHDRLSRSIEAANLHIAEKKSDAKTAGKDIKKRRRYSAERKQAKSDNISARHEARDATEIVNLIVQERDDVEHRFGLNEKKGGKSKK